MSEKSEAVLDKTVEPKKAGTVEIALDKVEEIKKEAVNFKDSLVGRLQDLHVEMKDWHFGVQSNEDGVTVDVTVKVLLRSEPK